MVEAGSLLLVGGGRMGGALLAGWLRHGVAASAVTVIEPRHDTAAALRRRHGVTVLPALAELSAPAAPDAPDGPDAPNAIVVAVKPQVMDTAIAGLAVRVEAGTLVLSIAAGKTLAYFAARLGASAAVVRAMPNTPAAVERGIAALVANGRVDGAQRRLAESLVAAVGETLWLEDEAHMDLVTAVSGSGPAYVFLLIETLARAAVAAGLPRDIAMRLARATVTGAGELAYRSDETATRLREDVTTPGGTTSAALELLMAEDGLQPLVDGAVRAAARRSRELAG